MIEIRELKSCFYFIENIEHIAILNLIPVYDSFMFTSVDALPFALIGLNKTLLKLANLEFGKIMTVFHAFVKNVISTNKSKIKLQDDNSVVKLMLDPKNGFTDQEILEEILLITIASFATSTKTLSAILVMLGIHQEVQQNLCDEIDEIISAEGQNHNFEICFLKKFTYLDAVVKETMRLFPPIPIIGREASEEVNIDGYLIPKGTVILISLISMHRDEKYWGNDAHLFRPERFLKELKNPKAYVPFADGKRICIGYKYAMISMKIFLINFLRNYKVICSTKYEDIRTEMTLTLNFVEGYKISLQKR